MPLVGCLPNPDAAPVAVQPTNAPVRTLTSFSEALRCMDELFLSNGKSGFVIASSNIPDATGKIAVGVRDMLITSISRMSVKSGAFRYIDADTGGNDTVSNFRTKMIDAQQLKPDVPQVYVTGSISQADQAVETGKQGIGVTTGILDFGADRDRNVSLVTLELHLGDMMTASLIAGIDASNTIAVVRSGSGLDSGASIKKVGISFNFSTDRSEGTGQAVRTLVELGAIELLGKWTKVPYWTCLEIERTNPAIIKQLRDWWDVMQPPQQTAFIVSGLISGGYLDPAEQSPSDGRLREAISKFQSDRNIVPNGRVGFDIYEQMMGPSTRMASAGAPPPTHAPVDLSTPLKINLNTTKAGEYEVGDEVVFRLSTSRTAFVRCYYEDSKRNVYQLYPTPDQPEKQIQGNRAILIPDPVFRDKMSITLDQKETMVCLATETDPTTRLPPALSHAPALSELKVDGVDQVVVLYRAAVPEPGKLADAKSFAQAR